MNDAPTLYCSTKRRNQEEKEKKLRMMIIRRLCIRLDASMRKYIDHTQVATSNLCSTER